MQHSIKRVVIVGAGPCGLVALKEMLDSGHDAILFERSAQLGGVFASAVAYPDLHLTITNWAMAFSDFPDPTRLRYSTAEEYLQYLQCYTRHFDLERHIQYSSEVKDATLAEDGLWSLQVKQTKRGVETIVQMQADAMIVATGSNQLPKEVPPGLSRFEGRMIHSSDYNAAFREEVARGNLRVLVVGGGESGADISAELGSSSPSVTVWLRRPICVGPRYLNKVNEMKQIEANKEVDFPANGFLEAATTNRMSATQNVYSYGLFRRILWHTPVLNSTLSQMCLRGTTPAFIRNDQATYVTKNQRMCEAIHEGKLDIIVCPSITTKGHICRFRAPNDPDLRRKFDVVVLCTGFRADFSWIHLPGNTALSWNPRSWFLHCFPKGFGHCLFFVGYARPHQGGVPVMAEMLSRYIALLLLSQKSLPVDYAAQAQRDGAAEREYYSLSPDLHTLVDYNAFLESVARRIGCEPRLPLSCVVVFNLHMLVVLLLCLKWWNSSLVQCNFRFLWHFLAAITAACFMHHHGILIKWWFYPQWAVWYRQRGPGARPELLDSVLSRVNVWNSTAITSGFVLLILWSVPTLYAQRLLSIFLILPNAVFAALGIPFTQALGGFLRPKIFALHSCTWRLADLFQP